MIFDQIISQWYDFICKFDLSSVEGKVYFDFKLLCWLLCYICLSLELVVSEMLWIMLNLLLYQCYVLCFFVNVYGWKQSRTMTVS